MLQSAHHRQLRCKVYLSAACQQSSVLQQAGGAPFCREEGAQLLLGPVPQHALQWEAIDHGGVRNLVSILPCDAVTVKGCMSVSDMSCKLGSEGWVCCTGAMEAIG